MGNILRDVKVTQVLGYYGAGTTKETSDIIDMSCYEGCLFVISFAGLTAGGVLTPLVEDNIINSASGMTTLVPGCTAYTVSTAAATQAKGVILVDVYKPINEFLQCSITPSSQTAIILGIVAIQYQGKFKPVPDVTPLPLIATQIVGGAGQ